MYECVYFHLHSMFLNITKSMNKFDKQLEWKYFQLAKSPPQAYVPYLGLTEVIYEGFFS